MRDKENTKRRLINAVGDILKTEGYKGLGVNKIAKQAEVHKKLIYRYFKNVDNLIEAYVVEKDYWMMSSPQIDLTSPDFSTLKFVTEILQNQFTYFSSEPEMQRLILWEISENTPLMRSIHNVRESMGQEMLKLTDPHFEGSVVNFRAVAALLVGGIYYSILHTRFNGGMICDVDLNSEEGRQAILAAIQQIVGWAYKEAEK